MTVLSDKDIRLRLNQVSEVGSSAKDILGIEPCEDRQVQPASIDLTLATEWRIFVDPMFHPWEPIDIDNVKAVKTRKVFSDSYTLYPHELILCSTREYVHIPHNIQAQVHGKSSLGRLGLLVHVTAGFIDPGFKGKITLEMYNLNKRPIVLRAGKRICQISMTKLSSPAAYPYGHERLKSKYQDQCEVTGSLYDG